MIKRPPDTIGPPKPNGSIVEYAYRDAGNWKVWGEFALSGTLAFSEIENLLHDQLWFVPDAIGIKSLVPEIRNMDDHPLHEIHGIRLAQVDEPLMSREWFIMRLQWGFKKGWLALCPW